MRLCGGFTGSQTRRPAAPDSPRRQLADQVVAHVQNLQLLGFAQPVGQGLHVVPGGAEEPLL